MFGADFASLEDRISALTTKDPMKLDVYTKGYDGHCLRAYYYFGDKMPDIIDTVESINSIKDKYPDERQESKAPTFALTYQGTWHTMVNNLGWSPEKSKSVEAAYHDLYKVSDQWVADKLHGAASCGYLTVAFGLRVRTPILAQTILGKKSTPYEAAAEGRTAGNALGQAYGLLNNRAGIEFQERLEASPYKNDIRIFAQIHDATYGDTDNNIGAIKWLNDNLPACMRWQELSEIQHDEVKLSGEVDLHYPNWSKAFTLPNGASKQEILNLCK